LLSFLSFEVKNYEITIVFLFPTLNICFALACVHHLLLPKASERSLCASALNNKQTTCSFTAPPKVITEREIINEKWQTQ
jgi:hypothetical protein